MNATSIKTKLEALANVIMVVMASAIGYRVLTRSTASDQATRAVAAGDHLATLPGLDWNQHRRTLLLVLNTGCQFCQDSVPFYQKLAQAQRPHSDEALEIVAVFPNETEMVRQFTTHESLSIRSVSGVPLEKLGVNATPTLILVDREGQVERAWVGILTSQEEIDLLKLASGS